jgi:hypothetical protein
VTWKSIGVIGRKKLREFIGEPKQRQWQALLKRAGLDGPLPKELNSGGSWYIPRNKLTREEAKRLLQLRYAELGERRLKAKPGSKR